MKETILRTAAAAGTSFMTTLIGGWDKAVEILLIFIVLDYLTGLAAAFKSKQVQSSIGFEGLCKKGAIFLVVILAAQLDRVTGNAAGLFRTATAFFFVANEGISLIENVAALGVRLPAFLTTALKKMRDDSERMDDGDSYDGEDEPYDE